MKPLPTSLIFAIILSLTTIALAQQPDAPQEDARAFPYMAEINGADVYIRSGPGTNYYDCGKFKNGDVVKVVAAQHGWSRIVPPLGSFSWISKQYVDYDPNSPEVGTVTGDAVRVYAGSGHVKPLYSTTLQGKLNRQEKVKLLGEEKGGYLKIAPPPFAYLWVSSKFANPLDQPVPATLPAQAPPPVPVTPQPKEPPALSQPPTQTPTAPTDKLAEYTKLEDKLKAEKQKPINQQNYDLIKADLKKLADDESAGKAARFAQYSLRNIERCEMAQQVDKKTRTQDEQLEEIMQRIINARDKKLAEFPDLGQYDAVGILMVSAEYSAAKHHRHYRIVDDKGKTVCYALPVGIAQELNLRNLVGKKVGITGKILPHPQSAGALIEFTKISQVD
ncbi:MAG: SH3 domain-containing protein [Planctomycetota bacterium]|jgi:uncharacterized protein YgiM (DUF1202 family)